MGEFIASHADATEGEDGASQEYYDPSKVDFSQPLAGYKKLVMPGTGKVLEAREDFEKIIETPALKGVLALYDKNVQTLSHNANSESVGGFATIEINYNTLSDENREIVRDLDIAVPDDDKRDGSGQRWISIKVPVAEDDTVGDVSERLFEATQPFVRQDVLYGSREVTEEYLDKLTDWLYNGGYDQFLEDRQNPTLEAVLALKDPSIVYYGEENRVFANQELLNKHLDYLESQK